MLGTARRKKETAVSLPATVPFAEAFKVWVKVAAYSFGGPAGQIAVMHRLLVEEKRWVSENRFLHALNYAMLLPGPEAQQLATYLGWLLHGTGGGLVAGTLFILPGFVSILVLSMLYAGFNDVGFVQAVFYGLKPAVMAIVATAVVRIGQRALGNRLKVGIMLFAFVAMFFFNVPFPLIIIVPGLSGYLAGKRWPAAFDARVPLAAEADGDTAVADQAAQIRKPDGRYARRVLVICLALWFGPLLLLGIFLGWDHTFVEIGRFFSQAAVVTFGGAYAVLAYIAQQAVNVHHWLAPGEMLDGLGMAETTPGPLVQVVQFVGFMGAYRHPGTLPPMLAGVLGAILTTWVTFVPCFLWIFLGAPYIETLRGRHALTRALSAITAAVVGVILNLAVWFSLQTLFGAVNTVHLGPLQLLVPVWSTLDPAALLIAVGAFVALFGLRWGIFRTLALSALVGTAVFLLRPV